MAYAAKTKVSTEKTLAEIKKLLNQKGAEKTVFYDEDSRAAIGFEMDGRVLRFVLPLPLKGASEFKQTPVRGYWRTDEEAYGAWEQACRQRWRALLLILKAKFEAVEAEILTFEEVFLAHILLPNKQTVGECFVPQLDAVYAGETVPLLLPGLPEPKGGE